MLTGNRSDQQLIVLSAYFSEQTALILNNRLQTALILNKGWGQDTVLNLQEDMRPNEETTDKG